MVTYQELVEFLKTRYRFSVARCMHCYAVYCDRERIPIVGLDKHLHCCSRPFVLFSIPDESPRASGVYRLSNLIPSKLLILGIEFIDRASVM